MYDTSQKALFLLLLFLLHTFHYDMSQEPGNEGIKLKCRYNYVNLISSSYLTTRKMTNRQRENMIKRITKKLSEILVNYSVMKGLNTCLHTCHLHTATTFADNYKQTLT